MEIYFAGSIRGGRDDVDLYARIIDLLDRHGEVLTEHVGESDLETQEAEVTDGEIHDQDLAWLRRADAVVAEVTVPSLGVGYELGRAVAWGKPVLCLYRPDGEHDLSAMVRGSDALTVVECDDPASLESTVASFLDGCR
ncbi:nucleoside 2-deoxyribosyltransferase [Halobacteriales archaeon SW_10_68_16]|jgi:nucleoside 2-deoxyribosyltransferase|nr:MAG: nucleoside 2-deoxyribosyltransferase [Halobacteriales archaeon SW_10_68_16]